MWLQSGEPGVVGLVREPGHDGVLRVDLQDQRQVGHVLARGAQQAAEVGAHSVLIGHEAGRRLGQAVRDPDLFRLVAQRLPHALDDRLVFVRGHLPRVALLPAQCPEVEVALRHRLQRLALELPEVGDHPLVHPVVQQQDLDALLPEDLQVRAVPRRREAVRGDVVDALLPLLRAGEVVGERHRLIGRSVCVDAKRSSFATRCWLPASCPTPSFRTRPNSRQKSA